MLHKKYLYKSAVTVGYVMRLLCTMCYVKWPLSNSDIMTYAMWI